MPYLKYNHVYYLAFNQRIKFSLNEHDILVCTSLLLSIFVVVVVLIIITVVVDVGVIAGFFSMINSGKVLAE